MPILEVELVGDADTGDRSALAQRIADAAARVFKSPPQGTWVRMRILSADDYAENSKAADGVRPVFVSVLKRTNPTGAELADEIRNLTEGVARACGRPAENVHIRYEPSGAGRQSFGGTLT
jgi:phenylpyruvate tautomerase PptA (4-oxalocrotonate tautomerase family)